MKNTKPLYHGHRFPLEIISHAVWLYHRFCLSFRDVEDFLAERGVGVSYESIRQWCCRFGPDYAHKLKKRRGRLGDTWFLDEDLSRLVALFFATTVGSLCWASSAVRRLEWASPFRDAARAANARSAALVVVLGWEAFALPSRWPVPETHGDDIGATHS